MTTRNRQVVFAFGEGDESTLTPAVRGGKGAGLAEMAKLGINVPPGFTVSTTVARAYNEHGRLPKRVVAQLHRGLAQLESETGRTFGGTRSPLLVSVRSGARVSMPGMMDTVLNVGLNPTTVSALAREVDEVFALDSYARFLRQFGVTVLGIEPEKFDATAVASKKQSIERFQALIERETGAPMPDSPLTQLGMAIFAVLGSWTSERGVAYRQAERIPHWWGTAYTVQAMVFGNMGEDSCTGVVFSRCPKTGARRIYGEFLPNAQGEDVVAGTRTPFPIREMARWNRAIAEELCWNVLQLERHFGDLVDVEFTVEQGRLYILQCRAGKRSAQAAATFAVHQVWDGTWSKKEALERVPATEVAKLERPSFDAAALAAAEKLATGIAAAPGVATGVVVTSSAEAAQAAVAGRKVILVRPDTAPEDLPGMLAAEAVVTAVGGETSHAAVVARGLGKPSVVGCGDVSRLKEGETISVCGNTGVVVCGGVPTTASKPTKEVRIFLSWVNQFGVKAKFAEPRIGFEFVGEQFSANTLLNNFYLADAMATAAAGSRLAARAASLRTKVHEELAELFACYLTIAVAGEVRHSRGSASLTGDAAQAADVLARDFSVSFGGERAYSQTKVLGGLKNKSRSEQIDFFRLAQTAFEGSWSSSYGGKRWAAIAAAPLAFLEGKLGHSVFVDHAFDLQHNGGRMFDKHGLLTGHTDEYTLRCQLDAKKHAAGGVATLYVALTNLHSTVGEEVANLYADGHKQGLW